MKRMRAIIRHIYGAWLDKRLPVSDYIQLTQKRIFIFPNKIGWLYLVFLILLFITGINYQNNLILSVGFIMVSVLITTIVATYQNLSSLIIKTSACDNVFVGDFVALPVTFENINKANKRGLMVGFEQSPCQLVPAIEREQRVNLLFRPSERGLLSVPRIKLYSVFPMGLFMCWSWLRLEFNGLVYPKPVDFPFRMSAGEAGDQDHSKTLISGMDEFDGLRSYQKGDSMKRVAWRQFAKTQQLMTKHYSDLQADERCLDWYALTGIDVELRLKILAGWVVDCHKQQCQYSLKLPHKIIEQNSGESHFRYCLKELALFGLAGNSHG